MVEVQDQGDQIAVRQDGELRGYVGFVDYRERRHCDTVDLVVTSPPYFVNQDYELGMTWEEYLELLEDMYLFISECLRPGGYACINFGDQARGKDIIDLAEAYCTIPMARYHDEFGWGADLELTGTRIWRKKFHRMGVPFVCNHHPRHVFDYEYLWTWRKPDGEGKEIVRDRKLSQRGVLEFDGDNPKKRYPAAFPVGLPEWCMKVYSDPNDTVLDPFMGSGTTALAALRQGLYFFGYEIDADLKPLITATILEANNG